MSKILLIMPVRLGGERNMVFGRLKRKGFEMLLTDREEEWIEIVKNELPDLILADMENVRPDESDFMAHSLKIVQKTYKIPIIFMIDERTPLEKQKFINADDYHIKPIEIPRLLEKMKRLLSTDSK